MTLIRSIAALSVSTCLVSCGEDPELLRKSREQQTEVVKLRSELALMEEKLRNLPPDKSEDLTTAKKQAEAQTAEITALEAEISNLDTRRKALEDEFNSYKRKYPVR